MDVRGYLAGLSRRDRRMLAVVAVASVPMVILPHVPGVTAYHQDILHLGLVFVMLGITWNIIAGYAGQISLGHSAFFGIGAYVAAWMTTPGSVPPWLGDPLSVLSAPPIVAILVGAAAAGVLALLTGPAMFRLRGHYFAIGTLALAAIIQVIMNNARAYSGGATGYYVNEPSGLSLPGLTVEPAMLHFYYALVATLATIAIALYIYRSKSGLGMRAIHGDEHAADSLGVDPFRYKMYAFVVSSFLVGLAGALYGQYTLYLNPGSTLAIAWIIDALIIVILGGMSTVFGPVFGAAIFLVLDTMLGDVIGELSTTVEGIIIILFVLFLPDGIYGYAEERWERGRSLWPEWLGGEA